MRNRRPRSFRHRPNGRHFGRRSNDNKDRLISGVFSNGRNKNNFKQHQSAEKLLERYKVLAKEALSSGDKILSENYLQHVDHFNRIISFKNSEQKQNAIKEISPTQDSNNNFPETKKEINIEKKE